MSNFHFSKVNNRKEEGRGFIPIRGNPVCMYSVCIQRMYSICIVFYMYSTLYTKILRDKLLDVLNEITDFAFKGGTRDYVTVYNSGAFWSRSKSKTRRSCSLQKIKFYLEFLINSSFFQVGSKIFRQVIDIPMGSDPASFFSKPFLFFYRSKWLMVNG